MIAKKILSIWLKNTCLPGENAVFQEYGIPSLGGFKMKILDIKTFKNRDKKGRKKDYLRANSYPDTKKLIRSKCNKLLV